MMRMIEGLKIVLVGAFLGVASIPVSAYALLFLLQSAEMPSGVSWALSAAIAPLLVSLAVGLFMKLDRPLLGGACIGLAAVVLLVLVDRINKDVAGPFGLLEFAVVFLVPTAMVPFLAWLRVRYHGARATG